MPFDDPLTFSATRDELLGALEDVSSTDPGLLAGQAAVAAGSRAAVYLCAPGSVRRVDAWFADGDLVLHGYSTRPDEKVVGSVHHGSAALLAWAQLLRVEATAPSETAGVGLAGSLTFSTHEGFVQRFASAAVGSVTGLPSSAGALVMIARPDEPAWCIARLDEATGPAGRPRNTATMLDDAGSLWGSADAGRPLTLSRGGFAEMWSQMTSFVAQPVGNLHE